MPTNASSSVAIKMAPTKTKKLAILEIQNRPRLELKFASQWNSNISVKICMLPMACNAIGNAMVLKKDKDN